MARLDEMIGVKALPTAEAAGEVGQDELGDVVHRVDVGRCQNTLAKQSQDSAADCKDAWREM